ncbi:two-component system sensor histidine kinase NtrB [Tuwongella immobilis]|uniref:histidine kinase n=1 Tax=Tuwongella immobilis TaxID=692036 RepID=A0A6C2YS68_9BACT|nr:ATP-binding protein [Tuwongella immobilis]VIP04316.1 pas pac sensor hybrid histidine kinase : Sensor histidine kinase response regulator, PAS domain-containing OS=Geobacter bemidjiensis (strain Bem / ATCC BAA-1014 / DSM 16622) GN=Gbem_2419 PE=4 SV=1: HisKA: HATPase_c [Tuwongella immobilis]VTS05994.1 pas pac sensor hybrid histidine kinase : Sensor histidine kinase response regulator, PAS domain-containing OS=Geobacter bemidjiensis (strain Bem / ATCC BAA-1014 / DSM 16622) GN=Gbem_2419 PE=4 SV=1:
MTTPYPCLEMCPHSPRVIGPAPATILQATREFLDRHPNPSSGSVLLMDLLASLVNLLQCSGGAVWEMTAEPPDQMVPRLLLGIRKPQESETWGMLGFPRMSPADLARLEQLITPVLMGGPPLFLTLRHSDAEQPAQSQMLPVERLLVLPLEYHGVRFGVLLLVNVPELPEPGWPTVLDPLLTACGTLINWSSARPTNPARPGTPFSRFSVRAELPNRQSSLARMAGGFSHDFNNLLTSIMGYAELTLMELPIDSPFVRNLQEILHTSYRAANLTRQLMLLSGRGCFAMMALDIHEQIDRAIDLLRDRISPTIQFRRNYFEANHTIAGDPEALITVFEHLFMNAVEGLGTRPGEIQCSTVWFEELGEEIDWSLPPASPHQPGALVSILDSGIGIPPEHLDFVFDPYFSTKFAGRGLGLAIVWGVMRSHGGGIQIRSKPGHGTQVDLFFPHRYNS